MTTVAEKAKALAEQGYFVFPLNMDGTPRTENGFKDSSDDPYYTLDRFEKYGEKAKIGVATGRSGIVVLDLDYKEDANGNVVVDGFNSVDQAWVDVKESYAYTSTGGHGRHIWYSAPEGKNLPRKIGYRKMAGVDRCSGDGYVVFNGESIPKRSELVEAPEWLQDESATRTAERFEGDVKAWYETLEDGEPNALVRRAIEDVEKLFAERGNDLTHSDIIEAQHRAIRLGAEGNAGVAVLIDRLEELTLSREGAHSRDADEYLYEFQEGLLSGIEKHGAAIEIRNNLPEYSISLVPSGVSDRLVAGEPGDKNVFRELLAALIEAGVDDETATSILWNSPRTKDLARDWGLLFTHQRVQQARVTPEPIRENPALAEVEVLGEEHSTSEYLTDKELAQVQATDTFIDAYVQASASKGFVNTDFAVPAAWTCLSMAFGTRAFVPIGSTPLEMNLWFTVLGLSGTGKTSESEFMKDVLNVFMNEDSDVSYTMSPNSSPEGMELDLLHRDGRATLIYEDEASSFFMNLRTKDWMASLTDKFALWFNGRVKGSTKLSAKDMRGMSATTSLSSYMGATPDRLISLIDASMFASGFMARTNWVWGAPPLNPDAKYEITYANTTEKRVAPAAYELAIDMAVMVSDMKPTAIIGTEAATKRVVKAYKAMDKKAQKHRRYDSIEPSMTRLKETLMKCSALMALSRGVTTFDVEDVLVAIYYAETWFKTLLRVADEISESPYSRDLDHIVHFVDESGGKVLRSTLLHEMRGKVLRNKSEIDDRIGYLLESGRLNRIEQNREIAYELNGGGK